MRNIGYYLYPAYYCLYNLHLLGAIAMRLRHSDWTKLFNAIAEINSDSDPATLAGRAIKTANSLISGEITAFDFFT